ncbi:MAG: bacillithiol biosynthesis deacetylase BshB1 [Flavobacteriales bacterium]
MELDILAIAAHPDDVELCCSGTLSKQIKAGYKVGVVDLTQGEMGTRGSAEIRLQEADDSAKALGLALRENLKMDDAFFTNDQEHQLRIVEVVRRFRPRIVITNAVDDRHPDHGRASSLVSDAVFYAGLPKVKGQNREEEAWRPEFLLHFIQDRYITPDLVVDISEHFEKKMETIRCFRSQFYDPLSDEPETPLSRSDFLDFVEARAREFGRPIGAEFGEGFTTERAMGVPDLGLLY